MRKFGDIDKLETAAERRQEQEEIKNIYKEIGDLSSTSEDAFNKLAESINKKMEKKNNNKAEEWQK